MVVLGCGSSGIVLSEPRIPVINENYSDVIKLDQVSKILYIKNKDEQYVPAKFNDFEIEYTNIKKIIEENNDIFNNNYFLIPIDGGIIDKKKFIEEFNKGDIYCFNWLSKSKSYYNILNSLLNESDDLYQIIYDKGTKISTNIFVFLDKIINIKNILEIANKKGFYFDDIKLENLIYHDSNIKIIDFSEIINLNLSYDKIVEQITNSKFNCVYYFPYNTISNLLLYEYINKINKIGYLNINTNYFSLLYTNSIEYAINVKYKIKLINNLSWIFNKYLPNYKIKIKLLNYKFIDKINSEEDFQNLSEFESINMEDFTYSLLNILAFEKIYFNEYENNKTIINNTIKCYKNLIDKMYLDNKKQKIEFLLKNINIYSFGFIFVNWLYKNLNYIVNNSDLKIQLIKMFDIIILYCTNIILIDDNLYFAYPVYNIDKCIT